MFGPIVDRVVEEARNGCHCPSNVHERPWGRYIDHFRSKELVFKTIEVDPQRRLSRQLHEGREETWIVLSGSGIAQYQLEVCGPLFNQPLHPGIRIEIGMGIEHRLINNTDQLLVVAELQTGHCDENDIVRIEDDFGRVL